MSSPTLIKFSLDLHKIFLLWFNKKLFEFQFQRQIWSLSFCGTLCQSKLYGQTPETRHFFACKSFKLISLPHETCENTSTLKPISNELENFLFSSFLHSPRRFTKPILIAVWTSKADRVSVKTISCKFVSSPSGIAFHQHEFPQPTTWLIKCNTFFLFLPLHRGNS